MGRVDRARTTSLLCEWELAKVHFYNAKGNLTITENGDIQMIKNQTQLMPNIVLISLDAVRADHLSCYGGYKRETTPFLNTFVKEATVYESAYTAARWTLPAHTSLFTGMSNSKHGISADWTNLQALDDRRIVTLAEFLKSLGYQTAAYSSIEFIAPRTRLDRGFEHFEQVWTLLDSSHVIYRYVNQLPEKLKTLVWGINKFYEKFLRSDKGARRINQMFKQWLERPSQEKPFFAFLHYFDAHAKYWPPEPYRSAFIKPEAEVKRITKKHIAPWLHLTGQQTISPEEFDILAKLYDSELLYLDHTLKQLINCLAENGVLDETLIIITSDHGECFGEHGYYQHSSPCLHEPAIHVPLIIRYPEHFPTGQRIAVPVSIIDIFPTIVELLCNGDGVLEQFQGISLMGMPDSMPEDRIVVIESLTTPASSLYSIDSDIDRAKFDYFLRALRWRNYKYIWHSQGNHELYDLSSDPGEEENQIGIQSQIENFMHSNLKRWLELSPQCQTQSGSDKELDPEVRRRLAELGYC